MKKIYSIFFAMILCSNLVGVELQLISKSEGTFKKSDLMRFKECFNINSFIETGTYAGDTTNLASNIFEQVYSIEIYEPLYKNAKNRFRGKSNIHLYFGDTCDMFQQMIQESSARRLYWLDAHSSGGGTGGRPGFSPISAELSQFKNYGSLEDIILIDDLRGMYHCDSRTNLPLKQIDQDVKSIDSDFVFYSIGDIGIIYNTRIYPSITVSDIVKATTFSRLFDSSTETLSTLSQLVHEESLIASVDENTVEGKVLFKLKDWVNVNCLGGEVIYFYWNTLYQLQNGDYPSAIKNFNILAQSHFSHWRIYAYLIRALLLDQQVEKALEIFKQELQDKYIEFPTIIESIIGAEFKYIS